MLPKRFLPLKSTSLCDPYRHSAEVKFSPSKIITHINLLNILCFYLLDVVKIWDAVSAYIESYMKQSKVN
jgi:hypothetical protein